MKRVIALVMVAMVTAGLLAGCTIVKGSGAIITEDMDFSDFNRVEVGYAFEVEVVQSDQFSVSITADDNLFEYIRVSREGTTLRIGTQPAVIFRSATYRAKVTMPQLVSLELSGATRGTVSGFESVEDLDIEVSGASSLELEEIVAGDTTFDVSGASRVIGEITAKDINFNISGASTVRLQGMADDIKLDLSGASHVEMADFLVTSAEVDFSGASSGTVHVDGTLDVELSGASSLTYLGNAILGDVDVSGASSLHGD
jgi:hypothetical protein